jgi:hypothetical protein
LIESGAPSFEIARAQAALSSQLQNVGKTTQPLIKTQLDDLTAQFNKGQIGYRGFENRLHKILHDDGITLQQALKAGGPAFAAAFKAQVAALGQQARAITAIPAKFRGIGGAGGAADIKIVHPLQVIQQEQTKIGNAAQRQRNQQIRYAREIAKYQAELVKKQHDKTIAQNADDHHRRTRAAHTAPVGEQGPIRPGYGRVGPSGPQGPIGASAPSGPQGPISLERIRAGIVHETATASAQRKQQINASNRISAEVGRLGGSFAAAEEAHVARPLDVLHQGNLRIAAAAEQQRDAMLKAQQRTNAELRALRRHGATPPGFGKYPHGTGSKDARMGAKAGNRS